MTFIPLLLLMIFNYKTKVYFKNFWVSKIELSKNFVMEDSWKKITYYHYLTKSTLNLIKDLRIFSSDKLKYLPDPVLNLSDIRKKNRKLI